LDDDPPEHVLPAAIGGTLTTDKVCFACNQRASREIDQPFVNEWPIVLARNEFQILDRRGKRPPRLPQKTTSADGTRIVVETWGGPWEARPLPEVTPTATGFDVSAADHAELDRIQADLERKVGRKGGQLSFGQRQTRVVDDKFEASFKFSPSAWLRMTAKMALGCASLVWPERWLDTPSAQQTQQLLWDQSGKDGTVPAQPDGPLVHLCSAPEHLLFFMGQGQRTKFVAMVFGNEVVGLDLELHGESHPQTAWLMDGRGGAVQALTMDALMLRTAQNAGLIPRNPNP
jgi:hypothetical protein